MSLAEPWARALRGQWLCAPGGSLPGAVPTLPVTSWQAVTRSWAVLGPCLEAHASAVWCRAGSPCGGGAQSHVMMPSWHHDKQEKAEVTRSKKIWCLGLGGGQPPAGERL